MVFGARILREAAANMVKEVDGKNWVLTYVARVITIVHSAYM
jgi:hypothetical protein